MANEIIPEEFKRKSQSQTSEISIYSSVSDYSSWGALLSGPHSFVVRGFKGLVPLRKVQGFLILTQSSD